MEIAPSTSLGPDAGQDANEWARASDLISEASACKPIVFDQSMLKVVPKQIRYMRVFVLVTISVNVLQIGLCTGGDESRLLPDLVCQISEHVFTVVFVGEFIIKICLARSVILETLWGRLEFLLIAAAIVDSWVLEPIIGFKDRSGHPVLIVFWVLRMLRFVRLVHLQPAAYQLVEGLVASMEGVVRVCAMLGLLIYASAIFCVTFFQHVKFEDPMTFESIPRAMLTLFSISIIAEWTDVIWPVVQAHPWSPLFFIVFICIGTFGLLNQLVAQITQTTLRIQSYYEREDENKRQRNSIDRARDMSRLLFDEAVDDCLTHQEMLKLAEDEGEKGGGIRFAESQVHLGLPANFKLWDCVRLFDRDSSGTISKQEFEDGLKDLIFADESMRSMMTHFALADIKKQQVDLKEFITERFHRLRAALDLPPDDVESIEFNKKEQEGPPLPGGGAIKVPPPAENIPLDWGQRQQHKRQDPPLRQNNVEACSVLVERLREPLVQFLADSLATATLPEVLPAPTWGAAPRSDLKGQGQLNMSRLSEDSSDQQSPDTFQHSANQETGRSASWLAGCLSSSDDHEKSGIVCELVDSKDPPSQALQEQAAKVAAVASDPSDSYRSPRTAEMPEVMSV